MAKKCIECGEEANYRIKDTSDYYCEECALESFGDLALLLQVEEEAQNLKDFIVKKLAPQEIEEMEQDNKQDNKEDDE